MENNMNTEWITDRLPTKEDSDVWVTFENGYVAYWPWTSVEAGMPWKPVQKPKPYVKPNVKPKRWTVKWGGEDGASDFFTLYDSGEFRYYLPELTSDQADAARRICDIYNEVAP